MVVSSTGELISRLNPLGPFHSPHLEGPLTQLADRHGTVNLQLKALDWSGVQQCTEHTFSIDALAEIGSPTLDRVLFSPNKDGIADAVTITAQMRESGTLGVAISPAQAQSGGAKKITGSPIRHLVSNQAVLPGNTATIWDGRDDQGNVVPDGWYGAVFTFTDTCGNQQQLELFVESDITPPAAEIHYPAVNSPLAMIVEVTGSVSDPHFKSYRVDVGAGTLPDNWVTLHTRERSIQNDILAQWNTAGLSGPHVLRLLASDQVGNTTIIETPVTLTARTTLISALLATPPLFSPNGDGIRETTNFTLGVEENILFTLSLLDQDHRIRRTLTVDRPAQAGVKQLIWDGTDASGMNLNVPDGSYTASVRAVLASHPSVTQEENVTVVVDSTPPHINITRPSQGFATSAGQVQGSITDEHLRAYTVSLTSLPDNTQVLLSRGSNNAVKADFGSLQNLPEGRYILTVEARDEGDIARKEEFPFIIDQTPPVVSLAAPEPNLLLGMAHNPIAIVGTLSDDYLAHYEVRIGTGKAPTKWTVLSHQTTQPSSDVLSQWDFSNLADGHYALDVTAEDKAGLRTNAQVQLTIDQTPPTVELTLPTDGAYVTGALDLTGTATDKHLVSYQLELAPISAGDKRSTIGSGTGAVRDGRLLQWQGLAPDGIYQLRLTAIDRADNTAEITRQITIDTTPPTAPSDLQATLTANQNVQLTWQLVDASDLATYVVYRDGQQLSPSPLITPSYLDSTASEGSYVYTVVARDHAGLYSAPSNAVTIRADRTSPQATISAPLPGASVSGPVQIMGTAYSREDFKTYRVFIGEGPSPSAWQLLRQSPVPIQAGHLSSWQPLELSEGALYSIKLEAEDLNGNIGNDQVQVTVDQQPPAAPTGFAFSVTGNDILLSWDDHTAPDLLGYLIYRNGQLLQLHSGVTANLRQVALSSSTYTDRQVADGTWAYTLIAIDQAGNLSPPSAPATVTIDNYPPQAEIVTPQDDTTFEEPLYVLAQVADQDIAHVQFEYTDTASTTWHSLPPLDTTPPYETMFDPKALHLPFAQYQLRAVATDTANRADPVPLPISVTYTNLTRPARVLGLAARVQGNKITLLWDVANDPELAGYHIDRQQDKSATTRQTLSPVSEPLYIDLEVADATYRYTVVAVDHHGNESAPSEIALAQVYTPKMVSPFTPTPASTLSLSGQGITASTVTGVITTANKTTDLVPTTTDGSGTFSLTDIQLETGENDITLRLTDTSGNTSNPVSVRVTSAPPPSPPTGLSATAVHPLIDLAWKTNPEPNIAGYRLWRNGLPVLANRPLTGLTAHASVNAPSATKVLDDNNSTYWSPSGSTEGAWVSMTWPEPRQLQQVKLQWYSGFYQASDFDLQAWSGHHWVTLAAIRSNTDPTHLIELKQPYRTTQLRIVLQQSASPFTPRLASFRGHYSPLIIDTEYEDRVLDGYYTYNLNAINHYGFESSLSDSVKVAVGDVTGPAPVVLTGSSTDTDVHLEWTPSLDSDVHHYEVYRDGSLIVQIATLTSQQYLDPGLVNGTYRYTIQAVDHAGNRGPESNSMLFTIARIPPVPPSSLTVNAVAAGAALDLTWQATADIHVQVYRSRQSGGPYHQIADTTERSLSDTGLSNGTTYYYVVAAQDVVGNTSSFSNEASGTPHDRIKPIPPILHFPSSPGRLLVSQVPERTIMGSAEPGSQVQLRANGQPVAIAQSREVLEVITIPIIVGTLPTLSPDGRYLAFLDPQGVELNPGESEEGFEEETEEEPEEEATGGILRVYDIQTDNLIEVTEVHHLDHLTWSPDGTRLLFNDDNPARGASIIRQYEPSRDHLTDLTEAPDTNIRAAVVSPNGTQLLLNGTVQGREGLWLRAYHDDHYTLLIAATNIATSSLSWSPDERSIVYTHDHELNILDVETGQVRTQLATTDQAPQWAPDGQSLLYVPRASPPNQLQRYDLTTQTTQDIAIGRFPQWSADGQSILYLDPASQSLLRHDLSATVTTVLLDNLMLDHDHLQAVPSGFIGLATGPSHEAHTYRRLAPAGQVIFDSIRLQPGDNSYTATAIDAANNTSSASNSIIISHPISEQANLSLTVNDIRILPTVPSRNDLAHISLTIHNRGDLTSKATTVSLLVINPEGASVTLLDDYQIGPIAATDHLTITTDWQVENLAGRYTLVAVVDPDNTVSEHSDADNVALKDLVVPSASDLVVTVNTPTLVYQPNQVVDVAVSVANGGDVWTGNIEVRIEDANGFPVQLLIAQDITQLAYGTQLDFTATWATGSTFAGPYRIVAQLIHPSRIVATSATAPFRIVEAANLHATIISDRLHYTANEQVQVTGEISYQAGNQLLSEIEARLQVLSPHNERVTERTTTWGDLLPGAKATLTLDWNTEVYPVGTYSLLFEIATAGQILAQARDLLTITPSGRQLSGHLTLSEQTPSSGVTQTATYTISHHGNTPSQNVPIRVSLLDTLSGHILQTHTVSLNHLGSSPITGQVDFTTTSLRLQSYTVLLQAEVSENKDKMLTLATQDFSVTDHTAPSVTLLTPAPGGMISGHGAILVAAQDAHSSIQRVEYRIDNANWIPMPIQNALNHQYSVTLPPLSEGSHTLQARAVDTFNHQGLSPAVPFIAIRQLPRLP